MWLLALLLQPIAFYTHFRLFYYLSSHYWASLCCGIVAVAPFWLGLMGDYYGVWGLRTMVPRSVFVALYPLPLLWCIQFSNAWGAMIGFMGLGALVNVHPVSAPTLIVAAVIAYLTCASPSPGRRMLRLLAFAAGVSLAALPYVLTWMLNRSGSWSSSVPYEKVAELFQYRNRAYGDVPYAIGQLYLLLRQPHMLALLATSAAGLLLWWLRGRLSTAWKFALTACAGTVMISLLLAAVLAYECHTAGVPSSFQSLIRGVRFIVPLILLGQLALLGLAVEIIDSASSWRGGRAGRLIGCAAALLLVPGALYWSWRPRSTPRKVWAQDWADLGTYWFGASSAAARDVADAYRWIRAHTEPQARFLGDRTVRAACARSVVIDPLDVHVLLYSDPRAAVEWQDRVRGLQSVREFARAHGPARALAPLLCLADKLGADYGCDRSAPSEPFRGWVLFSNAHYAIYDVRDGPKWFDQGNYALWRDWTTRAAEDYARRKQPPSPARPCLWISNSLPMARAVAEVLPDAQGVYTYVPDSGRLYYTRGPDAHDSSEMSVAAVPQSEATGGRLLALMAGHRKCRGRVPVTLIWQDPAPPQVRSGEPVSRPGELPDPQADRYSVLMHGEAAEIHATWQAFETTWSLAQASQPGRPTRTAASRPARPGSER